MEVGRGGKLYLPAGSRAAIGRQRPRKDAGLHLGEYLLVFLAKAPVPVNQRPQRLFRQRALIEPGQVEPDLQVPQFVDCEGVGATAPAQRRQGFPLMRQLEVAGMGTRAGMVGAFAHPFQEEGTLDQV
jgi:hypothetical protein